MSRIGKKEIIIPAGVTAAVNGNIVDVSGKLGNLSRQIESVISVKVEDGKILVSRVNESKPAKAKHGLTRSLIANMVHGVSEGFSKSLTINGVGYKTQKQGSKLVLNIGYSHPVEFFEGDGITFELPGPKEILVKGIDREKVGQVAANIRAARPVEPYHHYGIYYTGERLRKKEGKTGKAGKK